VTQLDSGRHAAGSDEPVPSAFFVIGPAGSGKSTVSRLLARELGAAYLDKDSIATGFTELILTMNGNDPYERDNNALYQSRILPVEYQTLLRVCGDNLRVGASAVIDAPFGRYFGDEQYLVRASVECGWPPARLVVVHVVADGEIVRKRLRARYQPRDEWKLGHWEEFWAGARRPRLSSGYSCGQPVAAGAWAMVVA
jgi:predicted kinase